MAVLFLIFVFLFHITSAKDDAYDELFKSYQVKFGRKYGASEESVRRVVWERNARRVAQHNLEADFGLHSYRMELNSFSDKTAEELDVFRSCLLKRRNISGDFVEFPRSVPLPPSVDWRRKGLVTSVKDQGMCGSCWAFSATGALEGQTKVKTGKLVSLSEQNLVDCSTKQGNDGCDGGWMEYAFQYVMDNNGLDTEAAYEYRGKKGRCKFVPEGVGANCTGYHRVKHGSEEALQRAVAKVGPISVAIYVDETFMHYKNGIYNNSICLSRYLNHGVLVVGYGSENGSDYWIVKNSWGESWGVAGYVLMSRNARNQCGIASHAVFPSV